MRIFILRRLYDMHLCVHMRPYFKSQSIMKGMFLVTFPPHLYPMRGYRCAYVDEHGDGQHWIKEGEQNKPGNYQKDGRHEIKSGVVVVH